MIYIDNITDAQVVFVPKTRTADGDLRFVVRNSVGRDVPIDVEVISLDTSDLYFNIALTLTEGMDDGEYEYRLSDTLGILSTGIMFIGGTTLPEEYKKTIEYEQFETE